MVDARNGKTGLTLHILLDIDVNTCGLLQWRHSVCDE